MFQTTIVLCLRIPPSSLPAFRTPRLSALVAATVTAVTTVFAASATPVTAAPKAAAPTLSIESKTCAIGATEEERSVTVTALALLGATGDRVTMRFSLQSRQGKAKWKSVLFKDPTTTKKWETTEAERAGLKLTKVIPSLPEGYQYRVVVESRGINAGGKVVTRTAKRNVLCNQPLFTPTLVLGKIEKTKARGVDGDAYVVPVKNLGRLASKPYVLSIARADTREQLASVRSSALKGGATNRTTVPLNGDCTGPVVIAVHEEGADPSALTPAQSVVVGCDGTPTPAATSSRRR